MNLGRGCTGHGPGKGSHPDMDGDGGEGPVVSVLLGSRDCSGATSGCTVSSLWTRIRATANGSHVLICTKYVVNSRKGDQYGAMFSA